MSIIKQAFLNPITVFKVIFNLDVPDSEYNLCNKLHYFTHRVFELILDLKNGEEILNGIFQKYGIRDEDIIKLERLSPKKRLPIFIDILREIQIDLLKLQCSLVINREQSEEVEWYILNLNRLYRNMGVDKKGFLWELDKSGRYNQEDLEFFVNYLDSFIDMTMKSMYYPDEVIETWKEFENMAKKPKVVTTTEFSFDNQGNLQFEVVKKDTVRFHDSEKEKMKELQREVNKLDKSQGCDLKNPEPTIDDEDDLDEELNKYRVVLCKAFYLINHVNIDKYTKSTIFGKVIEEVDVDKKFKKKSIWFTDDEVSSESKMFKIRFLSYVLSWLVKNLKPISNILYYVNKDGKFIEFDQKAEYAKDITERALSIMQKIANDEELTDDLMYFEKLMNLVNIDSKKTAKKFIDKIYRLGIQSEILNDNLKRFSWYPQGIAMDLMMRLAYLSSTNEYDVDTFLPKLDPNFKFRKEDSVRDSIILLGKAIRKARRKSGVPIGIQYFMKCNPIIESRWEDINHNKALITGIAALRYYAFLMNLPNIERIIMGMI